MGDFCAFLLVLCIDSNKRHAGAERTHGFLHWNGMSSFLWEFVKQPCPPAFFVDSMGKVWYDIRCWERKLLFSGSTSTRTRSLMDRTEASDAFNAGSIPVECTERRKVFLPLFFYVFNIFSRWFRLQKVQIFLAESVFPICPEGGVLPICISLYCWAVFWIVFSFLLK